LAVDIAGEPLEPVGPEATVEIPDWTSKPLWEMKFRNWASVIEKGCVAKRGGRPGGFSFCGLGGTPCYYSICPRRTFEEVAVYSKDDITQPVPSPNFVRQLTQATNRINKLEKLANRNRKTIAQLEQEKKED